MQQVQFIKKAQTLGFSLEDIGFDWMLPGKSGIELCYWLRSHNHALPVLILTAKDQIEDRITGLDAGADDYLVKPFSMAELLARLRALRRRQPKPRGKHSEVAGFAIKTLNAEIDHLQVPYFIPRECIVKISNDTGYEPDIAVIDRSNLANEPRWNQSSILEYGPSVPLAVEVVSTNWRDDYAIKMSDYEGIGIGEYWMIDYLGMGGRRYIGSPKQPTFTVCTLVDGEYELAQFRGADRIISPLFQT